MMSVVLLSLRNQVLAETVETVHLRLIRYLSLDPAAQGLLTRERVLDFSRALCSRDKAAIRAIESLLVDAEHLLTPPVAARVAVAGCGPRPERRPGSRRGAPTPPNRPRSPRRDRG